MSTTVYCYWYSLNNKVNKNFKRCLWFFFVCVGCTAGKQIPMCYPSSVTSARAMMLFNLGSAYCLRSEYEKARRCLHQVAVIIPWTCFKHRCFCMDQWKCTPLKLNSVAQKGITSIDNTLTLLWHIGEQCCRVLIKFLAQVHHLLRCVKVKWLVLSDVPTLWFQKFFGQIVSI